MVARFFFDGWFSAGYGIPCILLTDNGMQFVEKVFQTFRKILGIKKVFTSAYIPSTNEQNERFNRTVVDSMSAYVSEHQKDWDELAAITTYSYNMKNHSATGFTLFELVTSVPQSSLMAQVVLSPVNKERTKADYRNEFLAAVVENSSLSRERLATQQDR